MKHNAGVEAEINRRLFMEIIIHKMISVSKPPLLSDSPSKRPPKSASLPKRQSQSPQKRRAAAAAAAAANTLQSAYYSKCDIHRVLESRVSKTTPLRGTCQTCRTLHIRCVPLADNGTCEKCAQKGVSCVYQPRAAYGSTPRQHSSFDAEFAHNDYTNGGLPFDYTANKQSTSCYIPVPPVRPSSRSTPRNRVLRSRVTKPTACRGTCESCRKLHIRCVPLANNGTCEKCAQKGVSCIYQLKENVDGSRKNLSSRPSILPL